MLSVKRVYLIIICFLLTGCIQSNNETQQTPKAIKGVIDLREWDFEKDGSINLAGEWAFFWGELVEPDQILDLNQASFVSVPDAWSNYEIEGLTLTSEGYATYELTLYPPATTYAFGLYNEGQGTAYYLWLDGQLLTQNGQVGTSRESMTPEKLPNTIFFKPESETVEIALQISNFHHRNGGFRNSLLLGTAETIHRYQLQNWFVEAFSVGILFVMGLYHFFIFIFRKNDRLRYTLVYCVGHQ